MPAQVKKSALLAKLGDRGRTAFDAAKDAGYAPPTSGGGLPGGIEHGIAQVVKCEFGEYKDGNMKGQPFFMAQAVVKSPTHHGDVKVEGLRTMIMEPLCDTSTRARKTIEEHVEWVLNELKGMGVETDGASVDDLEDLAASVVATGPHVRFRTWSGSKQEVMQRTDGKWEITNDRANAGKVFPTEQAAKAANPYAGKEPGVNHVWMGFVEYGGEEVATEAVADKTPPAKSAAPVAKGAPAKPPAKPPVTTAKVAPAPAPEPEPTADDYTDQGDLDSLAERADADDTAAQETLTEMAEVAGIDDQAIKTAKNWTAVVELIKAGGIVEGGESTTDEPIAAAETPPAKGDVYDYSYVPDPKKKDPKTKQPVKVKLECEVDKVDVKVRTVDLHAVDDAKKKFKAVSWDDLAGE